MNEKVRCQSCGMPVADEYANFGTEADGSANREFCSFCYQDGAFTNPNQTVEEMVQSSIHHMSTSLGFSEEQARQMSETVIPGLKRWQN